MTESTPLTQLSDEDLVRDLQKKLKRRNIINLDEYFANPELDKYFKEIYSRYQKRIEYYCSRFIYDADMLGDIFHDIFIKVYLNIRRFRFKKTFKSWVYKIAHNSCINYIRKNKNLELSILNRKVKVQDASIKEFIDMYDSGEANIEDQIINKEIQEAINSAIMKLPVQYVNVFLLKTQAGLTFEEIANIEKKSSRSVKTIYQNALLFIKEELEKNNLEFNDLIL